MCQDGTSIVSGFRFRNLPLPQGARIARAYLEFATDGPYSADVTQQVYGEDSASAQSFSATQPGDTSRVLMTSDRVVWHIPADDIWELDMTRQSPDLTAIVQKIVNRSDWAPGTNALALIVKDAVVAAPNPDGTSFRRVVGYERPDTTYSGNVARLVVDLASPVKVTITDAQGQPVHELGLNADGWPVLNADTGALANPVTVAITVNDPSNAALMNVVFGSPNSSTRFYVGADPSSSGLCSGSPEKTSAPDNAFAYTHFEQRCLITGPQTYRWQVWIQPSSDGPFDVNVELSGPAPDFALVATAQAEVHVPQAEIRTPVIFIPGISGSWLDDNTLLMGKNLWLGSSGMPYRRLSLYDDDVKANHPDIVAPDVIRKVLVKNVYGPLLDQLQQIGYTEYQVNGDPSRRTIAGCDQFQKANQPRLFVFAYDWRQDNADTSRLLDSYVQCIRQLTTPGTNVDIVAHSMGGLVARRYILDHPGAVTKLVTIATPWLGAPKAINTLATGEFLDWIQHKTFISEADLQYAAGSFPGAGQLAPSELYYTVAPADLTPVVEKGLDWNDNGNAYDIYAYPDQVSALDKQFGRGRVSLGTINQAFHTHSSPSGKQDDWRRDGTGVRYYQIFGQTDRDNTIMQVSPATGVFCRPDDPEHPFTSSRCFFGAGTWLKFGPGDETVPLVSATMSGNGNDYAPAVKRRQVLTGDLTHLGLAGNPDALDHTVRFLTGLPVDTDEPLFGSATSAPLNSILPARAASVSLASVAAAAQESEPAYYLRIDNVAPASIVVSDALGHSTAPISGTFTGEVPDVTLINTGERSRTIILPTTATFTATFQTPDEPIAIELRVGTGDTTTRALAYRDLALPAEVTARLVFTPQGVDQLRYDQDGDGIFESSVTPTVDVSGSLASDREPPRISVSRSMQPGGIQITLDAQDSGSGMRSLSYSLDGTLFSAYSGAFVVDPGQTPVIYAFADDQAGNRTSLFQAPTNAPNVAPIVGAIATRLDPIVVNTAIMASAAFTDVNTGDTHTATWGWGDGSTAVGTVIETNGAGTVTGSHTYSAAGMYTVKLTVTDQNSATGQAVFQYVVVYDPGAGFTTGGGWITSPQGAYTPGPSVAGKASFGFNARYQKGASVPGGQIQFTFPAAKVDFHGTSYQWLVVSGAKAAFKGVGTINGRGDYGFLLTAHDGQISGGGGTDKFRIKIWDKASGAVIYDNQAGAADDANATMALGGGSIVIHK